MMPPPGFPPPNFNLPPPAFGGPPNSGPGMGPPQGMGMMGQQQQGPSNNASQELWVETKTAEGKVKHVDFTGQFTSKTGTCLGLFSLNFKVYSRSNFEFQC